MATPPTEEPFTASIQLHNAGDQPVLGPIAVALYTGAGGATMLLQTVTVPGPVPPGASAPGVLVSLPVGAIGPDGLIAVADDSGVVSECNELNDTDTWTANPCD